MDVGDTDVNQDRACRRYYGGVVMEDVDRDFGLHPVVAQSKLSR